MDSICQRLRQLFNRDRPELPPPPAIDPLSDAGYERLYFKLLERADEGWTRSQFLEQWDDRLEDKFFKSWLRRFGDKLLSSPAPNRELAQRMVHLGTILLSSRPSGALRTEEAPPPAYGDRVSALTPNPSPNGRGESEGEEIANLSTEYGRKLLDRELSPLAPEEYEPTFKLLLQKTANGKAAVLAFLRDFEARVSVAQWCEWLPGYGERLLAVEEPDQTTAKALLRLGDILAENDDSEGQTTLAELATRIGREMRDREIIWEVWEYEETIQNSKLKIKNGEDAGNVEDLLGQGKPLQRGDTMTLGELQKRAQQERESSEVKLPEGEDESDPEAWLKRGRELYNNSDFVGALSCCDKALDIKPDYHEAWYGRGLALAKLGRYEEAIASYDRAVDIKPDKHEAWSNRGVSLAKLGRYEEAIASYDRAVEFKPDDHQAWYNRGISLDNLGRNEEAIASYDKALEIKPDLHQAWINRGITMGNLPHPVSMPTTLILQHPHLNIPGYEGKLNSYEEGLKYCHQDTHPEGWGLLHHYIGRAHYFRGRYDIRRRSYCQKAFASYNNALKTLTETAFPQRHIEVLQDLIKVLLALGEPEQAAEMRRRGSEVLRRLLANTPSEAVKQRLALKFVSFQQYSVDLAVASGDCEAAWELAEAGKNACLTWLLPDLDPSSRPSGALRTEEAPPPSYTSQSPTIQNSKFKIQNGLFGDLLDSNTAAIYWHVSPAALTTFVLFCDRPAIVISSSSGDEASEGENDRLSQLLDWEKWLSDWNEQYDDYATKDSNASKIHPWRVEMEANLQRLGEILNINAILDCLGDRDRENIVQTDDRDRENTENGDRENTENGDRANAENGDRANAENGDRANAVRPYNLILVPHRDLHRFPLHYFFGDFACTYLPSISFGLQQQRQPWNAIDRLLLAENPKAKPEFGNVKKALAGLPFAEVEAALIEAIARENNSDVLRLEDNNTDKKITKDAIAIELIRSSEIHATEEKTDVGANGIRPIESVAVLSENAIVQPRNGFHFCGHGWYNNNDPANSCLFLNEDDRFTLYDIVNLDLSSYKIVSLAACETAVTGNQTITTEFVGLSSAFLSAGVRFTISTLWTVESAASAILMVEFYRQLQENPPAIALKTAQTWLQNATRQDLINWCEQNEPLLPGSLGLILEDERDRLSKLEGDRPYSHPYFWAAFTVSGV